MVICLGRKAFTMGKCTQPKHVSLTLLDDKIQAKQRPKHKRINEHTRSFFFQKVPAWIQDYLPLYNITQHAWYDIDQDYQWQVYCVTRQYQLIVNPGQSLSKPRTRRRCSAECKWDVWYTLKLKWRLWTYRTKVCP